jgi:MAF protein
MLESSLMIEIILASNSPRRRELLGLTGWNFRVAPAEVDERPWPGEAAPDYVLRLAQEKARTVSAASPGQSLVLAADTTVVDGGQIMGKPGSPAEARQMLIRLRGKGHQVYTAIAVLQPGCNLPSSQFTGGRMLVDLCCTQVPMREYPDAEMEAYLASGDPLDKAGAYAIQHAGFHPVERLDGCYANVVGLPLCHLVRTLDLLDLVPPWNVPQACQSALQYECPVYSHILSARAHGVDQQCPPGSSSFLTQGSRVSPG